ncbi:uncharacterized protein DUF2730 [Humitalea rosea]|uniref:Uncharacterized protein DUF2730 n=1 Tax=Humitalea rosea TaxID=990373 RepID=A0A2W7J5A5_9PROT|nr:DUF2730 family protein [Humitalea rosea]PZW46856.1 uncharacterized protein DUF2730 [Humitalea rosea]
MLETVLRSQPLLLAVLALLGGAGLWMLRQQTLSMVASQIKPLAATVSGQADRLTAVEASIASLPRDEDLRVLSARVADTERGVAVVGEQVRAVSSAVGRVEHMTTLLVEHQIGKAAR